jgi:NADP-dependent 3-hydroxy acid dehydrogenase YdfG
MTRESELNGDVVFITGASSGIGTAAARALASAGADVVVSARREERLESLAVDIESEYGVSCVAQQCNVREEDSVRSAIKATLDRFGKLDIVVSNAGIIRGEGVESFESEDFRAIMETNVNGTFYLTKAVMPYLRSTAGAIIYIGSFDAKYPRTFNPVYAASKWWLRGYAHSIAGDVGQDDVVVSLINPSKVRTEIGGAYGEQFKNQYDPGDILEPSHIAEAIQFAATREGCAISEMDVFAPDKYDREQF